MKQFHNSSWRYLEQMEDIIPLGGANGARLSYRGTVGVSYIPSAIPRAVSGTHTSNSALIAPGSSSAATPGNAQLEDLAPAGVSTPATSFSSIVSSSLPGIPPTPSPITPFESSSGKCCYSLISPDATNPFDDPSLLFSPPAHPSSSYSLSLVFQVALSPCASKRSQISAAPKDDQQSNIVAINTVNNSIQSLDDTIKTKFHDKLATIGSTTDQLYHVDGLMQDQIVDLGEHFAEHETKASVFFSLQPEERVIYANKLYNRYCTLSS
ncbi:hypothetical protein HD554DRAFT_2170720 [Boletus coccyginus]|nr:hypothetical protein HD554DRAFT_2170720 [Boletus coccyginus]